MDLDYRPRGHGIQVHRGLPGCAFSHHGFQGRDVRRAAAIPKAWHPRTTRIGTRSILCHLCNLRLLWHRQPRPSQCCGHQYGINLRYRPSGHRCNPLRLGGIRTPRRNPRHRAHYRRLRPVDDHRLRPGRALCNLLACRGDSRRLCDDFQRCLHRHRRGWRVRGLHHHDGHSIRCCPRHLL